MPKKTTSTPTTLERIQTFSPTPVSADQLKTPKKVGKKVAAAFPFDNPKVPKSKAKKITRKVTYTAPSPTVGLNAEVTVKPKTVSFKIGKQVIGVGDKWFFRFNNTSTGLRHPVDQVRVVSATPLTFTVKLDGPELTSAEEETFVLADFAKMASPFIERIEV